MIRTLKKMVDRYGITGIVVKTPSPHQSSQGIDELISDLRQLSEQSGIKLSFCTISMLTTQYGSNKLALAQAIIRKHPHHRRLAQVYQRESKNLNKKYHIRLFEAIACAELETGH
jgi:uncharacterized protein YgiM (DUF1202 family)